MRRVSRKDTKQAKKKQLQKTKTNSKRVSRKKGLIESDKKKAGKYRVKKRGQRDNEINAKREIKTKKIVDETENEPRTSRG